jgi:hypothetical protein
MAPEAKEAGLSSAAVPISRIFVAKPCKYQAIRKVMTLILNTLFN